MIGEVAIASAATGEHLPEEIRNHHETEIREDLRLREALSLGYSVCARCR